MTRKKKERKWTNPIYTAPTLRVYHMMRVAYRQRHQRWTIDEARAPSAAIPYSMLAPNRATASIPAPTNDSTTILVPAAFAGVAPVVAVAVGTTTVPVVRKGALVLEESTSPGDADEKTSVPVWAGTVTGPTVAVVGMGAMRPVAVSLPATLLSALAGAAALAMASSRD